MLNSKINLLIISGILLISAYCFGQKQSSGNFKRKSPTNSIQRQIPKDWKLVNLDAFSFILPKIMKDQKVQGIDSAVWRFESDEMELGIDSGNYIVTFGVEGFENKQYQVEIDGIKGQYFTVDYSKPRLPTIYIEDEEREKPFLEAIVFKRGNDFYSSFWIRCKKFGQIEIAKKVLYSINFKRK